MSSEKQFEFTKENIDLYLKEVAKEYRKQAGKIMSPDENATKVSRQAILMLSPKSERFLSIKLPKIAIEPIPKPRVKKA